MAKKKPRGTVNFKGIKAEIDKTKKGLKAQKVGASPAHKAKVEKKIAQLDKLVVAVADICCDQQWFCIPEELSEGELARTRRYGGRKR